MSKSKESDFEALVDSLGLIEGVAWRCVHCGHFFDLVSELPQQKSEFWTFVQNSLGESFCLLWCHLFGKKNERLHYHRFLSRPEIQAMGSQYSVPTIKARLLASAMLSESEFDKLWEEVLRCRDKYIGHRDVDAGAIVFPRTDLCLKIVEEFRCVLADCAKSLLAAKPDNEKLDVFVRFYGENSNSRVKTLAINKLAHGMKEGGQLAINLSLQSAAKFSNINQSFVQQSLSTDDNA